jgi:hypothetical protein
MNPELELSPPAPPEPDCDPCPPVPPEPLDELTPVPVCSFPAVHAGAAATNVASVKMAYGTTRSEIECRIFRCFQLASGAATKKRLVRSKTDSAEHFIDGPCVGPRSLS